MKHSNTKGDVSVTHTNIQMGGVSKRFLNALLYQDFYYLQDATLQQESDYMRLFLHLD